MSLPAVYTAVTAATLINPQASCFLLLCAIHHTPGYYSSWQCWSILSHGHNLCDDLSTPSLAPGLDGGGPSLLRLMSDFIGCCICLNCNSIPIVAELSAIASTRYSMRGSESSDWNALDCVCVPTFVKTRRLRSFYSAGVQCTFLLH